MERSSDIADVKPSRGGWRKACCNHGARGSQRMRARQALRAAMFRRDQSKHRIPQPVHAIRTDQALD